MTRLVGMLRYVCRETYNPTGREVERMDTEGMNNDQLNVFLENLAKLIEAVAKDPQDAAQIVRDSKPTK